MKLIDKSVLVAEIEKRMKEITERRKTSDGLVTATGQGVLAGYGDILSFINTLEVKEVSFSNNGWIDSSEQMPEETTQWSDTLQGHREWTESDLVLAWDSLYGCIVDCTKNGRWMSERRGGCTGQVVHGIIAWRPIPEFSKELLEKELTKNI